MGFEELGKKLAQLGQDTKTGVQKMNESRQINSKISEEKKKLNQMYRAIGEKIYKSNQDTPPEGLEEEFLVIKQALKNISLFTEQANKLKGVVYCEECGKEASRGEKFCSNCGTRLPEGEEDISEKMKQDAKDAVGEVGEIVSDAVDKTKDFVGNVADRADAFVKGLSFRKNTSDDIVYDMESYMNRTTEKSDVMMEPGPDEVNYEPGEQEETVEDAVDAAEDIAKEAAKTVTEKVEQITEAPEEAGEYVEHAPETSEKAVEDIAEVEAEDAVEELTEEASKEPLEESELEETEE